MKHPARHAFRITLTIVMFAIPARAAFGWNEPSEKDTHIVLQGQSLSATYVLKLKSRMEAEALEITKLMFDLAKKYTSATALTIAVRIDVSEADERYGIRDRGVVDLDQITIKDLTGVRKAGSYQSLLYGDYFWLPSKLQTGVERLLKTAEKQR